MISDSPEESQSWSHLRGCSWAVSVLSSCLCGNLHRTDSAGASGDPGRPVCRQPPSAPGTVEPLLSLSYSGTYTHTLTDTHWQLCWESCFTVSDLRLCVNGLFKTHLLINTFSWCAYRTSEFCTWGHSNFLKKVRLFMCALHVHNLYASPIYLILF